jgi:hypothetical protein
MALIESGAIATVAVIVLMKSILIKRSSHAFNNTTMDNDLALYGHVVYFDDNCLIERRPEMKSGPTKVYQLDPDCPEDLRADSGVEYNPLPKFEKGGTVVLKGFGDFPEKPLKITKVTADTISLSLEDVPF